MKSFFISAGLVAVGAAGLQSVLADDSANSSMPAPSPKIWSVSTTLRGFYDSNYAVDESNPHKGSYGIELTPSVAINDSLQQTDLGIRYTYGLYWYQQRQIMGINPFDQSHELDLWVDHAFDERWHATVSDTFGDGQEPELIGGGSSIAGGVPYRVNGDNIGNHFNFALDTQWTRELSSVVHYENDFYDYQNNGANLAVTDGTVGPPPTPTTYALTGNGASLAGLLNRIEQNAGLDMQWHFNPETMVFVGYDFDWVDYNANEPIQVSRDGKVPFYSRSRDYYSHQIHAGLQYQFLANLTGTASAGAQYVDSYNESAPGAEAWSPYANVSLTYTYLPGSYVQLGFDQGNNSTYIAEAATDGGLTQYQETSTFSGSINHHFTEKLIGSALAQYSYSEFHGGESIGPEALYSAGLNLTYIINQYLSTDVGYNYDKLRSDLPGTAYERNRVYIGLTATY
jgi:hypothetical protein